MKAPKNDKRHLIHSFSKSDITDSIKAHELGCRHDWVHCAEIICQISNLGVSEIAHIEIESYVAQQALQHHFSGKPQLSSASDWSVLLTG